MRSRVFTQPGSKEEKARIVGDTFVAGANVSAIARSNGLDPPQLFAWRRKAMASGVVAPSVRAPNRPVKFARFDAMRSDMVEIVIGDVVVRAGGDVEPDRLADVIRGFARHDSGRGAGLCGEHAG